MTSRGVIRAVHILGSGTSVPLRGRSSPGFAVEVEDAEGRPSVLLVDPSAGSLQRMVDGGLALERLAAVLFSHYHPDHVGDLVPILFALRNPRYRDLPKLPTLIGPPGLADLLGGLKTIFGSAVEHGDRLQIVEVSPFCPQRKGFATAGPIEVTAYPTVHTPESVAYRFESRSGQILTYSGDTDYCTEMAEAARNADLLVIECSFPENCKVSGHLIPSEVGRIAAAAGAKRVVLTHLYPECLDQDLLTPCRQYYSGEILLATDGLVLEMSD